MKLLSTILLAIAALPSLADATYALSMRLRVPAVRSASVSPVRAWETDKITALMTVRDDGNVVLDEVHSSRGLWYRAHARQFSISSIRTTSSRKLTWAMEILFVDALRPYSGEADRMYVVTVAGDGTKKRLAGTAAGVMTFCSWPAPYLGTTRDMWGYEAYMTSVSGKWTARIKP